MKSWKWWAGPLYEFLKHDRKWPISKQKKLQTSSIILAGKTIKKMVDTTIKWESLTKIRVVIECRSFLSVELASIVIWESLRLPLRGDDISWLLAKWRRTIHAHTHPSKLMRFISRKLGAHCAKGLSDVIARTWTEKLISVWATSPCYDNIRTKTERFNVINDSCSYFKTLGTKHKPYFEEFLEYF